MKRKINPRKCHRAAINQRNERRPALSCILHPFLSSTHNRFLMAGAYFLMGTDVGLLPGIVGWCRKKRRDEGWCNLLWPASKLKKDCWLARRLHHDWFFLFLSFNPGSHSNLSWSWINERKNQSSDPLEIKTWPGNLFILFPFARPSVFISWGSGQFLSFHYQLYDGISFIPIIID